MTHTCNVVHAHNSHCYNLVLHSVWSVIYTVCNQHTPYLAYNKHDDVVYKKHHTKHKNEKYANYEVCEKSVINLIFFYKYKSFFRIVRSI